MLKFKCHVTLGAWPVLETISGVSLFTWLLACFRGRAHVVTAGLCWDRHTNLDLALKDIVKVVLAFYVRASVGCRAADAYGERLIVFWWFISFLQN